MVSPDQALNKENLHSTRHQLIILNQINTILSSLINTEQVVSSLLCILLIHEFFSFSQIYVFSVSESDGTLQGDYCIGYKDKREKNKALQQIKHEIEYLKQGMKTQMPGPDETSTRLLYHELMDMSSYICHTRIDKKRKSLHTGKMLQDYCLSYYNKGSEILHKPIKTQAISYITDESLSARVKLNEYVPPPPFLIIPLAARNNVFKIIIASKCLEEAPGFNKVEVTLLEWILKRLTFIFENCFRYEELEKAYEDLRQVDKIKTNFISIISHELQTPLINIIGYSHLLADYQLGEVNPQQKQALKKILSKAEHLHDQIRQILFRARLDSGDIWDEERRNILVRDLFEDIIHRYQQKTYEKKVEFRINLPREKVNIYVRPQMLRNMVCILVGNAIKFSHSPVLVDIHVYIGKDRAFHVKVKDNGIGIIPEEREEIFKQFYQVEATLQREYPGMGIGLSTLHELIKALNGKILLKSTPGKGSTFEFILPFEEVFEA